MPTTLSPILKEGIYVFTTVSDPMSVPRGIALMEFTEDEGTTLITRKEDADQLGLSYNYEAAWITVSLVTALDTIGITAAFASLLSDAQISCNVVAAFYHDHIFVPYYRRIEAVEILSSASLNI